MRLIDVDALREECGLAELCTDCSRCGKDDCDSPMYSMKQFCWWLDDAPTVGGWISVNDDLPEEHDSIFANHTHLSKHLWAKESDNVIVYVRFPDGTGRSTEGRLHDGKWWTRISPTLEPVITHWMPMPEPPEEKKNETD